MQTNMKNFYSAVVNSSVRETPFARLIFVISRVLFYAALVWALIILPVHLLVQHSSSVGDSDTVFIEYDSVFIAYVFSFFAFIFAGAVSLIISSILLSQVFKLVNYILTGSAVDNIYYEGTYYDNASVAVCQLFDKLLEPIFYALTSPLLFVERLIDGDWDQKLKEQKQKETELRLAHYQEDLDYQAAIKEIEAYLGR